MSDQNDCPGDALDWTPEMAIRSALDALLTDQVFSSIQLEPNKVMVIFLHDENESYSTKYFQSGMYMSEMISLLEIVKSRLQDHINGKDA